MELTVDEFLPSVEATPALLARLWSICVGTESAGMGTIHGSFECTEGHSRIRCDDCTVAKHHTKTKEQPTIEARFYVKTQKNPNSFQTASALQTSKAELQNVCDDLRLSITRYKRAKIASREEADEIAKNISSGPEEKKKHTDCPDDAKSSAKTSHRLPEEKVLEPTMADFMRLLYIVSADQITHKLMCKILALVPDLSVCMYPIKGFAVVTTPMSIKLLQSDSRPSSFQTGFLTLDQERRIVPLHPADPQAKVYTLVGVWVAGLPNVAAQAEEFAANESVHKSKSAEPMSKDMKLKKIAEREDKKARYLNHPLVMAAILRFLFTDEIKSRMSPKPKTNENASPCYLLVHFTGATALPQFLEFRLKSDRENGNSWALLESAHSLPREPKSGAFKPVRLKLTCNKDFAQGQESYMVYKFSYIISLHQDAHTVKGKRMVQAKKPPPQEDQENSEPNVPDSASKQPGRSRNQSLRQGAGHDVCSAEQRPVKACAVHHPKDLKSTTHGAVKPIMMVKLRNPDPADQKSQHRKRNESVRMVADSPSAPSLVGARPVEGHHHHIVHPEAARTLNSNTEITKSGTIDYSRPAVTITANNATFDSGRNVSRAIKVRPESVRAAPVTIREGIMKLKSGAVNLLRGKADNAQPEETSVQMDEVEEGVTGGVVYATQQKGSGGKEAGHAVPMQAQASENSQLDPAAAANNNPTPSKNNGSLNSSINSTCMHSSKLTGRVHPRLSGYSGLDQSSVADQFPSYSGNVSLVRTPEYSVLASAGRASPDVKRILIEQQRQIQMLHQQLVCVTEALRAMGPAGGKMSRSSYVSFGGTGTLNMSADLNLRGRTHMGMYPSTLNLSNNLSQSPPSFNRGNQTTDVNNVSSTSNSLSNINRLISGDILADISAVEPAQPPMQPVPFSLNMATAAPTAEVKVEMKPQGEARAPESAEMQYFATVQSRQIEEKKEPSGNSAKKPAASSPTKKLSSRKPRPDSSKSANTNTKQPTIRHGTRSAAILTTGASAGRRSEAAKTHHADAGKRPAVSDFTSKLSAGHRETKRPAKPDEIRVPKIVYPEVDPHHESQKQEAARRGENKAETAVGEGTRLETVASCEALSCIKETNESVINSPEQERAGGVGNPGKPTAGEQTRKKPQQVCGLVSPRGVDCGEKRLDHGHAQDRVPERLRLFS